MMKGKKSNSIYEAHFSFTFCILGLFSGKRTSVQDGTLSVFQNVFPSLSGKLKLLLGVEMVEEHPLSCC